MNVGNLKRMLNKYPDDMVIITERHSDYAVIEQSEWSVVKAVPGNDGWLMRSHPTMSEENKGKEKEYLLIEGN